MSPRDVDLRAADDAAIKKFKWLPEYVAYFKDPDGYIEEGRRSRVPSLQELMRATECIFKKYHKLFSESSEKKNKEHPYYAKYKEWIADPVEFARRTQAHVLSQSGEEFHTPAHYERWAKGCAQALHEHYAQHGFGPTSIDPRRLVSK